MLKIYRAFEHYGRIVLEDHIIFSKGRFSTGINGYGDIIINWLRDKNFEAIKYEWTSDKNYAETIRSLAKLRDGFITESNKVLFNPLSLDDFELRMVDAKDSKAFEKYGLNEEGILLFTENINLKYVNHDLVQRILGRYPETGMYLLKPGSTITMSTTTYPKVEETYEVFQSQNLGKQLVLSKLDRKIY